MRLSNPLTAAVVVVAALTLTPPLHSQPSAEGPTSSAALSEIAAALDRIAEMLELQVEGSRLDLLMKRVDASRGRLDRIETQLRAARADQETASADRIRLEQQLEAVREQAAGDDADPQFLGFQTRQLETEIELNRRRLSGLDSRVARLEHEIAVQEREISDWQAYIDRELSGLR